MLLCNMLTEKGSNVRPATLEPFLMQKKFFNVFK